MCFLSSRKAELGGISEQTREQMRWLRHLVVVNRCLQVCALSQCSVTLSDRPQPPTLPHQRCGGHALPDGGRHERHDVPESRVGRPGGAAVLPGDRGSAPPEPLPQPEYHWNFQRLVAVETWPQILSEDAVRPHFPARKAVNSWGLQRKCAVVFFYFFLSVFAADIFEVICLRAAACLMGCKVLSTAVATRGVVISLVHAVNGSAEDPEPFFLCVIYVEGSSKCIYQRLWVAGSILSQLPPVPSSTPFVYSRRL